MVGQGNEQENPTAPRTKGDARKAASLNVSGIDYSEVDYLGSRGASHEPSQPTVVARLTHAVMRRLPRVV